MAALEFNPNKPAVTKTYHWATYIPDRTTKAAFAIHANRGHALNAFQDRANAILYQWNINTNQWDEIYRIENYKMTHCESCNVEFYNWKTHTGSKGAYPYRRWVKDPLHLVTECWDCHKENK